MSFDPVLFDIVRADHPVEIRHPLVRRSFQVRPATVGEALGIYAAADALQEGDATAADALRAIAWHWLPFTLASVMCARSTPPEDLARDLAGLLDAIAPTPRRHRSRSRAAKQEARRDGWDIVVARYAGQFGVEPSKVQREPWPLFILMLGRMDELRARYQAELVGAWAATQDEKALNHLLDAAGFNDIPDYLPGEEMPDIPEERRRAAVEAAKRFRAIHDHGRA